jgi:hypothetical protein
VRSETRWLSEPNYRLIGQMTFCFSMNRGRANRWRATSGTFAQTCIVCCIMNPLDWREYFCLPGVTISSLFGSRAWYGKANTLLAHCFRASPSNSHLSTKVLIGCVTFVLCDSRLPLRKDRDAQLRCSSCLVSAA